MTTQEQKLVDLIAEHPGLDSVGLRAVGGWSGRRFGSLRQAELAGLIAYRDGGWHVAEGGASQGDDLAAPTR